MAGGPLGYAACARRHALAVSGSEPWGGGAAACGGKLWQWRGLCQQVQWLSPLCVCTPLVLAPMPPARKRTPASFLFSGCLPGLLHLRCGAPQTTAVQDALEVREAAHAAALGEKHALRSDLQRLLRERGALDSLRSLVAGALGRAAARGEGEGGGAGAAAAQQAVP